MCVLLATDPSSELRAVESECGPLHEHHKNHHLMLGQLHLLCGGHCPCPSWRCHGSAERSAIIHGEAESQVARVRVDARIIYEARRLQEEGDELESSSHFAQRLAHIEFLQRIDERRPPRRPRAAPRFGREDMMGSARKSHTNIRALVE